MRALILLAALLLLGACDSAEPPPPEECTEAPEANKGPWVTRMTETSVRITWETRAHGCVEVSYQPEDLSDDPRVMTGNEKETQVTSGYGEFLQFPDEVGTFIMATVDLKDLKPSTCYSYGVWKAPGEPRGRFCTARRSGDPIRFLAIGDTNPVLGQTAPLLTQVLPKKPDFTVHLGDLQYYSSVVESWQVWFKHMAPLLLAGAFLPSIGNHEEENDFVANEFSQYYERFFGNPGDLGDNRIYHFQSGGVHFVALDTENKEDLGTNGDQRNRVQVLLQAASTSPGYRFSVAYMHRPLYTLSDSTNIRSLRDSLVPLFAQSGVKLVLAGHAHGYERFDVSGIPYVVSGGGGGILGDVDGQTDDYPDEIPLRKAAANAFHAMIFDVTAGKLAGEAIDKDGATVDRFEYAVP